MLINLFIDISRFVFVYSFSVFYSLLVIIGITFAFISNPTLKYWTRKRRSDRPKCLTDPDLGEHKFVTVNGIKLHYVEKGDPSKPLMLFIHGFPEFWYSWRSQVREFSHDYWTVALDLRGFGDSDKPTNVEDYVIKHLVEDIRLLLLHLNRGKFILICHDWGSVIGCAFVEKHMDMVERYVIMSAVDLRSLAKIILCKLKQFLKSWYLFFFQMPKLPEFLFSLNDMEYFKMMLEGKEFNKNFTKDDLEAYKYTYSKPGSFKYPIHYYRANICVFRKFDDLTVTKFSPCLYLLGERDPYMTKESASEFMKLFKNVTFKIVPDANHFVQQAAPEIVNKLIRDFLN